MDTINVVGIRWPKSVDVLNQRKLEPVVETVLNEKESINHAVTTMLFDRGFNQCLVKWKDSVYVCDHKDNKQRTFSGSKVDYHPYIMYLK